MLHGLDLFSGYGGIALALSGWVKPIAYCEIEKYCQGILLSRMAEGLLPEAPIWDDVRTLSGDQFTEIPIDIIYGGFPCQDISCAGNGKGLEGERSGLFFEIMRLAKEIKPKLLFLENVSAIRTKGLSVVLQQLAEAGYDCRYGFLSAYDMGAPHLRERWFLLAHASSVGIWDTKIFGEKCQSTSVSFNHGQEKSLAYSKSNGWEQGFKNTGGSDERMGPRKEYGFRHVCETMANTNSSGRLRKDSSQSKKWINNLKSLGEGNHKRWKNTESWWKIEPDVGRVVDGCPARVDRIKALGNGVVPMQAREAFKRLMGIKHD